jgi:hypothetical protein
MKQTAVSWIIHNIAKDQIKKAKSISEWAGIIKEWVSIFKQANKMFEQQIIEAYNKGEFNDGMNETAEEYFNNTYNS